MAVRRGSKNVAIQDLTPMFLWDLLATRADLVLVTGDKWLLQDELMQPRVILPQTFVAQWQH